MWVGNFKGNKKKLFYKVKMLWIDKRYLCVKCKNEVVVIEIVDICYLWLYG